MKMRNKKYFSHVIILLLFLFASDSLAIWDFIEGSGSHDSKLIQENFVESHIHDPSQTNDHANKVDTCIFCPCCVSNVNIITSFFYFTTKTTFLSNLKLFSFEANSWSEHKVYRPPQYLPHTIF